jgi:glycosyltransferase involved in cell wall biosynthesis
MLLYASRFFRLAQLLDRLLHRYQFNLLYVNGPRVLPPAAWIAKLRGLPVVFHCHNRLLQASAIKLAGRSLGRPDSHLIGCCQYAADPLRKYVAPPQIKVLFNGVPDMSLGNTRPLRSVKRIGIVGRVDTEKGQLEFVRAARLVAKRIQNCEFMVVGAPTFSGVEYYKRTVALSEGLPISFVDWQDDIAQVYSDLDLLVVSSRATEATTRVILEAYSARVPVVAFPSGGIPEILRDGETGFLTAAISPEALAERIVSALQMDKERLSNLAERARREWARYYTVEIYRDGVCNFLAGAALSRAAA